MRLGRYPSTPFNSDWIGVSTWSSAKTWRTAIRPNSQISSEAIRPIVLPRD